MKIKLKEITVRELSKDYIDNQEGGVSGYGGKLDIRPPYQREFIYKDKQRDAVINTVINKFPLNVMYWSVQDDNTFEIIDGQQRTISICQYIGSEFSFNKKYFHNLQEDEKKKILDYKLTIYLCSGTDSEKLEWFKTINIAGEKLYDQELRNAVYHGPWVSDAKKYFSKRDCPAYAIGNYYLDGSPIRQDYLETTIKWINDNNVEEYMGINQKKKSAKDLWNYFENVVNWTEKNFKKKRSFMKGLPWGEYYNEFKQKKIDPEKIEKAITELIKYSDQIKLKGIYIFVLTGNQKYLSVRKFPDNIKHKVYEKQKQKCVTCKETFEISDMEADHVKPWFSGGETIESNCQMLCRPHHYEKTETQTKVLRKQLSI